LIASWPAGFEWVERANRLETLLSGADYVSLHVPLTPETRHLIAAPQLALMKRDAVLVNCARGGTVDEAALHAALAGGALPSAATRARERSSIVWPRRPTSSPDTRAARTPGTASAAATTRSCSTWCRRACSTRASGA